MVILTIGFKSNKIKISDQDIRIVVKIVYLTDWFNYNGSHIQMLTIGCLIMYDDQINFILSLLCFVSYQTKHINQLYDIIIKYDYNTKRVVDICCCL